MIILKIFLFASLATLALVATTIFFAGVGRLVMFGFRRWGRAGTAFTSILIICLLALLWVGYSRKLAFDRLPPELAVEDLIYKETEFGGFGPGANSYGIYLFKLSESQSALIERGGVAYLNRLAMRGAMNGEGVLKWGITPIVDCGEQTICDAPARLGLPRNLSNLVERAVSTPGRFYSSDGASSTLLISPTDNTIIYFYGR